MLHDVLLQRDSTKSSPAWTRKALQGDTDEYEAFLAIHGALAIEEKVAEAKAARVFVSCK